MGPGAWMARAEEDLRAARACLESDPPIERPALFHAQQVAEKALKAVLAGDPSVVPPRIHDLEVLLDLASADADLAELKEHAVFLTRFAVAPRYPGDLAPVAPSEVREALQRAEEVFRRVQELLDQERESS